MILPVTTCSTPHLYIQNAAVDVVSLLELDSHPIAPTIEGRISKSRHYIVVVACLAMDAAELKRFQKLVDKLEGETISTEDLVDIINTFHDDAGFGGNVEEFIAAGGITALVKVALTGWPANARLSASKHPYDVVISTDKTARVDWQSLLGDNPRKWRSPRRNAISCLAEMGNYRQYVVQMERAGMFVLEALPRMLEQSFPHIDYSLHNKGNLFEAAKDQIQPVAVDLLNLAANAVVISRPLAMHITQQTALRVCKLYKDPHGLYIDKTVAERERLRRWRRSQGWDEDRIEDAVQQLKLQQQRKEDEEFGLTEHFCEMGGVDYFFIRFFNHVTQICSEEQLLALIHEGGLISKLKGCMNQKGAHRPSLWGPDIAIYKLTQVWTDKARGLSRELYKQIEAEERSSLDLRQQGNTAFKEGRLAEALQLYYRAASHNPQDHALFNNLSLVALRMGDPHEAMLGAMESITIDPAVAKSWCRLGDADRDMGRWQLAHLAYACSHELAAADADIKARKDDARSHLEVVWDIDDIPHPTRELNMNSKVAEWMGLSKQQMKRAARLTAAMEAADIYEALITGRENHSRVIACMQLKRDIEAARALAVATGALIPAQLPRSCRSLKRPDELATLFERWSISWTDMPLRHKKTGLIRHQLTIMSASAGTLRATKTVLGTPGLAAVKRVLLEAITTPAYGKPGIPTDLFLAHRMFPLFDSISALCKQWGFGVAAETAAEAKKSAANNDTDWEGYNHSDNYGDEVDVPSLLKGPDPNNGHLPEGAKAAAPCGEGDDARQQQDSHAQSGHQQQAGSAAAQGSKKSASSKGSSRGVGVPVGASRKGKGRK